MLDSDDEDERNVVKITVVGEPSTGKSTLCGRYLGTSTVHNGGTSGAEVMSGECRSLRPPPALQLCDVAGSALHTRMLHNYLYASHIVIFVYDLTNLQSFEKLDVWVKKVKEVFENEPKKPLLALFSNKSDLEHQRAVRLSCAQKFSSEYLMEHFKGSARTGEMVETAINSLVASVLGMKVKKLPAAANGKYSLPKVSEQNDENGRTSPQGVPRHSLIMNRKAFKRIQRKSSTVCVVQ